MRGTYGDVQALFLGGICSEQPDRRAFSSGIALRRRIRQARAPPDRLPNKRRPADRSPPFPDNPDADPTRHRFARRTGPHRVRAAGTESNRERARPQRIVDARQDCHGKYADEEARPPSAHARSHDSRT